MEPKPSSTPAICALLEETRDDRDNYRWAIEEAYAIMCSGKPPHSAREANARRVLRRALKRAGIAI